MTSTTIPRITLHLGSDILAENENEEDVDILQDLNLGELDITTVDMGFDEVGAHIQENLEHEFVKEALRKGVDLRQYAREIQKDLNVVEQESVTDYINQSENIAQLHNQIKACDNILENMEKLLGAFQTDLGSISSEIQTLQDESLSMNVKLKNRKEVQSRLDSFVSEIVISPTLITAINEREVNESYLEHLLDLNQKINFYNSQSNKHVLALGDVGPELERLRQKATVKIRDFLMGKLATLRKPGTNYQVIQNVLLKFKYFHQFLMEHHESTAVEIRRDYIDTMSKMYYSLFKQYLENIRRLIYEEAPDNQDLLGTEDNAKKGFFSSKLTMKNKSNIFILGDRAQLLQQLESPVIVPSVAKQQNQQFPFEVIFRCFTYALIDNATSEYMFMSDFFDVRGIDANDIFNGIFGKPALVFIKYLESMLTTCFDAIGLLLCNCVIQHYAISMQKRGIPCLDTYFEKVSQMIFPRLKHVLDLNIESLHTASVKKFGSVDVHPHYITRRYAEFASAIISLHEDFPDDNLLSSLKRLRIEMDNLISRFAQEFKSKKDQLIFLINNYDMILSILSERTKKPSKESEHFQALLTARTQEFVEETLMPVFGGMIAFVKEMEPVVESPAGANLKPDVALVERLVRSFAAEWKRAIDAMNSDVVHSFSNFKNGTAILQAVLTQLILYYTRFQNILNKPQFKNLSIRNELINIHHVMVEVKKHKQSY